MSEFKKVLKELRTQSKMTQEELAKKLGIAKSTISMYENGNREPDLEMMEAIADLFNVDMNYLHGLSNKTTRIISAKPKSNAVRINVYGRVPAGVPIDAIEDIIDLEEIPEEMTRGGKEFFGLRVIGDSMEPKYQDGDTIILWKTPTFDSGQDCVVYVNGYEATLKKVIKRHDGIILQPLNPSYEPKFYAYGDTSNPVIIAGVVVEIRRRV